MFLQIMKTLNDWFYVFTSKIFMQVFRFFWICSEKYIGFWAEDFELVFSDYIETFFIALGKFVSHRGRCSIIYYNCSNFVGADNFFKRLSWSRIQKYEAINSVEWKFNPPTTAWWERLNRLMKGLVNILAQACLNCEDIITVLADC